MRKRSSFVFCYLEFYSPSAEQYLSHKIASWNRKKVLSNYTTRIAIGAQYPGFALSFRRYGLN